MNNTNLFKHSPKELVTDAFLTWLFYFLDSKDELVEKKNTLFSQLLLNKEDKEKSVSNIKISKQKKGKNGRPDIVLDFRLNDVNKIILFENKTWTSTSNRQLSGYRKDYGEIYKYVFLKLAYVNIKEEQICKENGYDIITSKELSNALERLTKNHPIIEQYVEYLNHTFVDKIELLNDLIFNEGSFKAFKEADGQQIFASELYKKLSEKNMEHLFFNTGTSSGRPWTAIDILKNKILYKLGDSDKERTESIFWKIDIRSKKYFVRLNQYSYKPPKEYQPVKNQRLKKLREIANSLLDEFAELKGGKLTKGNNKAESEIVIFFEGQNTISGLLKQLPQFSKRFVEEYQKINL